MAEFLRLAIAITDTVGCVHRHGVVHKDLNPANIVLNPHTAGIKLIDFGISTRLASEDQTFRNLAVLEW